MRIIAGKFRGRRLKSPPSDRTRPTSDRLRETLFNILSPRIGGARFLDLCAGTGAVGIEAISRGAEHVTFVDQSRKMSKLIEDNLESLEIETGRFEIVTSDAAVFLRTNASKVPAFDVIYYDPPYSEDYEASLKAIGTSASLLSESGLVIVEHHKKKDLPEEFERLKCYRMVKQGDSVLSFYERCQ